MGGSMTLGGDATRLRDERTLLVRYRATRDPSVRDVIVERHLGLAASVAARYPHSSVPYEDRKQIACLGLLKAIERFDPDRGSAFSSFAVPTMLGELRRHFRQHTWTVRPPRDLQDRSLDVERATEALTRKLGRSPTSQELAAAVGCTLDQVLDALEAGRSRFGASLDEPLASDADTPLGETLGHDDTGYGHVEDTAAADWLLATLTPRQQRIVRLRFGQDLAQSEIGALVGCSQATVSREIRDALERLAAAMDPPDRVPQPA